VPNVAPTAEAGGPYSGTVGGSISLRGAASTDSDGTIATYAWDLDNDGQFDDATGVTASYSAATVGTFTVGLQVTDNDGATSTDTATITVNPVPNVAPTAEAGGPYSGTVGDTISLSGATSADSDGTIATYAWDLDNDGQYNDATGAAATFAATAVGTFTVGLQVTDDDGATNIDTATITVTIDMPVVFINEIMADNDTTIEDPDEAGAFEDWIELYNPGTASVDLSGFYLTDDAGNPTQWQFPAGSTIAAGGYLIIWADGESEQGNNHASFKLSAGGESVLLYNTDGTTLIDSIEFGAQTTDVSYGRFPNGSSTLVVLSAATPGAANTGDVTQTSARIYTPDSLVRQHDIPSDSIPTAILFRAFADAEISVTPIGTADVGQMIRIVNQSVELIGSFSGGVTTASVTAGNMYAIIFESHTESRVYDVQSTAQADAFSPSTTINFLQPTDTNGDSYTSPLDALIVINLLNAGVELSSSEFMCDVNQDGYASPIDALIIINEVNQRSGTSGEGEFVQTAAWQISPIVNSLTAEIDDDLTGNHLTVLTSDIDSPTPFEEASRQSQAIALVGFTRESELGVSDEDLDLLAEDWNRKHSIA
jgi:PKD repeat protein